MSHRRRTPEMARRRPELAVLALAPLSAGHESSAHPRRRDQEFESLSLQRRVRRAGGVIPQHSWPDPLASPSLEAVPRQDDAGLPHPSCLFDIRPSGRSGRGRCRAALLNNPITVPPGEMLLTRIPFSPSSAAAECVSTAWPGASSAPVCRLYSSVSYQPRDAFTL